MIIRQANRTPVSLDPVSSMLQRVLNRTQLSSNRRQRRTLKWEQQVGHNENVGQVLSHDHAVVHGFPMYCQCRSSQRGRTACLIWHAMLVQRPPLTSTTVEVLCGLQNCDAAVRTRPAPPTIPADISEGSVILTGPCSTP